MKDAYVYVDGFNFYYGALRENKDCKWLNLRSLFDEFCDELNIKTIKRVALLKKHQFSSPLSDSKGTFHKPDSW